MSTNVTSSSFNDGTTGSANAVANQIGASSSSSSKKRYNKPGARSSKRVKVPESGNGDIRSFFVPLAKKTTMITEQDRSYETKMNRNEDEDKEDPLAKKKTMITEQDRSYETKMNRNKDEDEEDANTHPSWVSDMEESFVSEDKTMATDTNTSREEWDDEPPKIQVVWKNKDTPTSSFDDSNEDESGYEPPNTDDTSLPHDSTEPSLRSSRSPSPENNTPLLSVEWRGTEYFFQKPSMLNDKEKIMKNLSLKSKIMFESNCPDIFVTLRDKISNIVNVLMQIDDDIIWNPMKIISDHNTDKRSGVYVLAIGANGIPLKVGMSFNCHTRVNEQAKTFCFKIADQERLASFLPRNMIEEIVALSLPGIQYHNDHSKRAMDMISMQIFEGYVAAAINSEHTPCVTNNVFEVLERIVPEPIQKLGIKDEDIFKCIEFFGKKSRVFAILSWRTLKSMVYNMAVKEHRDYIGTRLREEPKGKFCKLYWIKELFGKIFDGFQDCMENCPFFEERLAPAKDALNIELGSDSDPDEERIRSILEPISGENKETYVRPKASKLGACFVETFKDLNDKKDENVIFTVEKSTFDAARKHDSDWWNTEVDESKAIHLIDNQEYDLTLLTTNSGRRIVVTRAFFLAFSPEVCSWENRMKTVESMIVCLHLMTKVYNVDNERTRTELISYWLELNARKNSCPEKYTPRQARYYMPSGHMMGPMKNTMVLSKNLGTGMNVHTLLFLEFSLGEEKFRKLLKTLGLKTDRNDWWPSHPQWKCPGAPASPKHLEVTCAYDPNLNYVCMAESDSPFYGHFSCESCHSKLLFREIAILEAPGQNLSNKQRERLAKLIKHARPIRQGSSTQWRNDKIEEIGLSLVREKERDKKNRLNVTQHHLDRCKRNNQARDANRLFKPSGQNASINTKRKLDPYPDWLKWLFRHALIFYLERRHLRDMQGDPMRINKNALQSLLRSVLQKYEWTEDGTLKDGTVMYRLPQLKKSISELMEQAPNFPNYWIIKEDVNICTYPDSYRALEKELKAETLDYLSEEYPGTREEVETALRGTPYPY